MGIRSYYCCLKCDNYKVLVTATAPASAQNDIERHLHKSHGVDKGRASIHYMRTRTKR